MKNGKFTGMKKFVFLALLFTALFLGGCSNSVMPSDELNNASSNEIESDTLDNGMIKIHSSGKSVKLGTKNGNSKEKPEMTVKFDYDFLFGRHEVTCADFNELMGDSLAVECEQDDRPAANVTFYDAVLYANALSKREKKDTAYTYTKVEFDKEGRCVGLEGYAFNSEVDAYRLPTEAEWMYVAGLEWKPDRALFTKFLLSGYLNAGTHGVCRTDPNALVCDMVVNVMEWVNDWFGHFKDTTITNYIGAPNGGNLGERVLKGGGYRDDPYMVTAHSRGDVYTVTSTTKVPYLGFRLAFGKIPHAAYMSSKGQVSDKPITSMANQMTIRQYAGTYKAKLVFRNDVTGNLAYVDYSIGGNSVVEIEDTIDSYHPEISPDGKFVAFCTGLEGVDGESYVYVRDLVAKNSKAVKLNVRGAAIPRWRVLENGDTVIVYVTQTSNNKDKASFMRASTWQVEFSNGTFKTPKKLFDGAYHGGVSDDNSLAVTGARLLRARVNSNDTVWYDGEQACNVSLSKKGKRTLFLDFGGAPGRKFADSKYGVHEMILVADSTGNLVQGIPAPAGYSFDHTEWADDFVVATQTDKNGAHEKIVLVNPADSTVHDLVKGEELWHPSLWFSDDKIPEDETYNIDSAGVYYAYTVFGGFAMSSAELAFKMQKFWKVHKDVEFIALGSSMTLNAVIDDSIKTYKSLNMAFSLADIFCMRYLFEHYILPYATNLKVLMVELNPGFLFRKSDDIWKNIYASSPGLIYDKVHLNEQTKDDIAELSQIQEYSSDMFSSEYVEGTFLLPIGSWKEPTFSVDTSYYKWSNRDLQNSLSSLSAIKRKAEAKGIKVFLNITPRNPLYKNTGSYCYFGPRRSLVNKIIRTLRYKGYYIFDENKGGHHDYSNIMAANNVHLSILGAQKYTARLDELLRKGF